MKAARWHQKKDIRVEDIKEPSPKKGEVKIAVKYCGICGSDLHEYVAGPVLIPTKPHPLTGRDASEPITLGHEFSGEIVEVGEGVKKWKVGDRVVADACIYCGECPMCKEGAYNLCPQLGFNGLSTDGAFAEYVVVPEYQLYKLPDSVTFEEGALMEPLAVSVHGFRQSGAKVGDSVLVVGAGPIGIGVIQAAKAAGARLVIVVEILDTRKKFAKEFGADVVIDPTKEDVIETVKSLTDGIGVDVSIECVGAQTTLETAINTVRPGGTAVTVGIFEKPSCINYNSIVLAEKKIVGSCAYRGDFKWTIQLVKQGKINARGMITKKITLDNIVPEGFDELVHHRNEHLKIIVSP